MTLTRAVAAFESSNTRAFTTLLPAVFIAAVGPCVSVDSRVSDMAKRSAGKQVRAAKQIADLAVTTPVVIAQRISRMAVPGSQTSAAGKRESRRMVGEKVAASTEAAIGMTAALMRANANFTTLLMRSWFQPGRSPGEKANALANLMLSSVADVSSSVVAPALRKAKANARRLSR